MCLATLCRRSQVTNSVSLSLLKLHCYSDSLLLTSFTSFMPNCSLPFLHLLSLLSILPQATSDDPPFLSVGTEVSAKYRGAFCEATVKVAKKQVKCKVQQLDHSHSFDSLSFIRSFTCSNSHTFSIDLLTHSSTHPLTHSFIQKYYSYCQHTFVYKQKCNCNTSNVHMGRRISLDHQWYSVSSRTQTSWALFTHSLTASE